MIQLLKRRPAAILTFVALLCAVGMQAATAQVHVYIENNSECATTARFHLIHDDGIQQYWTPVYPLAALGGWAEHWTLTDEWSVDGILIGGAAVPIPTTGNCELTGSTCPDNICNTADFNYYLE